MARIHSIKIKNFRCFQEFEHVFNNVNFVCIIGRGDSGKSTILDSISYALSSSWNLMFFDSDFYHCATDIPIEIEVTLVDLPEKLIQENKYGLYIRGIDETTKEIKDDLEDNHAKALTVKLEVKKDLEPKWYVINNRQKSPFPISARDRAKLNVFMISDYVDRHFSWNKGMPLYSLLKQQQIADDSEENNVVIDALREAKNKIDNASFGQFEDVTKTIISKAAELGITISNTSTSIDFKDVAIKGGKFCLHDDKIPFRLKGKGSKRLISIAIQMALADKGGILLIDEIEQGLEADRIKHLVRTMAKETHGQIFITTHSPSVIEEVGVKSILTAKTDNGVGKFIQCDDTFQGVIRACPEAAYAKKVIVCEGKTEIGICRAMDVHRSNNFAAKDVVYTSGEGDSFTERALKLKELSLNVCVFCDSDKDSELSPSKVDLKDKKINIFDCESGKAIEDQVFKDLPWDAIKELIIYEEKKSSDDAVKNSVNSKCSESLSNNWQETDTPEKRTALAETAKNKRWFKRIDHGEFLGSVIFKYLDEIKNKPLGKQLDELSKWIDNG